MEIEEIKEEKRKTEDMILNILSEFTRKTGLSIEGIDFFVNHMVGGNNIYSDIKLDVRL